MSTIQSSSPIDIAARSQSRLFILYVVVLIVGAIGAALMTVFVYRAGNRYQAAVQADADARIAEADSRAAEALENAGKANERAGLANAEAARANEGLAQSNVEIARLTAEAERAKAERADADKQIANAQATAAIANERAAVANESAERERMTRLKLEETLAPRMIGFTGASTEELKLFAGTKAFFLVITDPECQQLAAQMSFMLKQAGWNILGTATTPLSLVQEGIEVNTKTLWAQANQSPLHSAARLLSYQLKDLKIKALARPMPNRWPEGIDPEAVLIMIGPKPQTYFSDKLFELMPMSEEMRQAIQENKRTRDQTMERAKEETRDYERRDRRELIERQREALKAQAKPD